MNSLPCPTEAMEGDTLVAYLRTRGIAFTHIGNESGSGRRDAMLRGAKMKRQGTSRGFPDYCIALPGVGVLYVELKRVRGGTVSPEQKQWIDVLNQCPGTEAMIAKGAAAAIERVEQLLPHKRDILHTEF